MLKLVLIIVNVIFGHLKSLYDGHFIGQTCVELPAKVVNEVEPILGHVLFHLLRVFSWGQVRIFFVEAENMLDFETSEDFSDFDRLGQGDTDDIGLETIGSNLFQTVVKFLQW